MIRKRLGQAGLGGLPEIRPICYKSEPSAVWRALFTFPLVPTYPGTCLSRLNGTMSWDGLSRAAWLLAVVELSQPSLRHVLRIGKTPKGPARVSERVLAVTLFSCHLSREAATVQNWYVTLSSTPALPVWSWMSHLYGVNFSFLPSKVENVATSWYSCEDSMMVVMLIHNQYECNWLWWKLNKSQYICFCFTFFLRNN